MFGSDNTLVTDLDLINTELHRCLVALNMDTILTVSTKHTGFYRCLVVTILNVLKIIK